MSTKSIITVGMFDGVHRGHQDLLRRLRYEAEQRQLVPTVITFEDHPLTLISPSKAPMNLMTIDDKVNAIRQAGISRVEVLPFDNNLRSKTAEQFMALLRDRYDAQALLLGFNHRFGSDRIDDINHYQSAGQKLGLEIIRADELNDPQLPGLCSSAIRSAISEGDVTSANAMLGHPYRLLGRVVKGHQLGRTIGFPTANVIALDPRQIIPARGVYAADVILPDGGVVRSMVNIGVRPTVERDDQAALTIEVHLIDWEGDLYGATIELDFIAHLRSEIQFPSLDTLREQLLQDELIAKNL